MTKVFKTRYFLLLASFVMFFAANSLQPGMVQQRNLHHLSTRPAKEGLPPEYALLNSALGGFRGLLLSTLWVRAQDMKNEGKFYEMIDIYNLITKMQPNHHAAWAFQSWDLAYNVSVEHENYNDRVFWVFRGVDMLQKQGIPKNPDIPELYLELARFYSHKIGQESDDAHPLYRIYLARRVEDAFEILPGLQAATVDGETQTKYLEAIVAIPEDKRELFKNKGFTEFTKKLKKLGYDIFNDNLLIRSRTRRPKEVAELVGDNKDYKEYIHRAGVWNVGERIREKLGMNPKEMYRMAQYYGPIDWRIPFAQALYWSEQGWQVEKRVNPDSSCIKYIRSVRQALISLVHQGKVFFASTDIRAAQYFYVPNYKFYDALIKHYEETYAMLVARGQKDYTLTGFRSSYTNFLKDAVFKCYFDDNKIQANKILKKLQDYTKEDKYKISLAKFIKDNFEEYFSTATRRDATNWLFAMTKTGYFYLMIGDINRYGYRRKLAEEYYNGYCMNRWPPDNRKNPDDADYSAHFPSLTQIRKSAAIQILMGGDERFIIPMQQALPRALQYYEPDTFRELRDEIQRQQQQQNKREP